VNTAAKVQQMMDEWKKESVEKTVFVVRLANACLGWAYVYGARGEYCSPANRRRFYASKGKDNPTIKTKCKNFNGDGYSGCSGCKWYPGGATRFYDCRGFTYWLFLQVGITINGGGATSQYNDDSNWMQKGPIAEMPKDKVCCVFRWDGKTMAHTLLYDGDGHYIHDSGEVKKCNVIAYNATHYAIPKGLYDEPIPPAPTPTPPEGKAIVTGRDVALREGPGTNTRVMLRVKTGEMVTLTTVVGWTYVHYRNDYGFMMNEYISVGDESVTVTGRRVALRAGTSTSTRVLDRIDTGTVVPREKLPDGWAYVEYGGKKGFMMKQFIKEG